MKFNVYNVLGNKIEDVDFSKAVYDIKPHQQSMFDLVITEGANNRQGTSATKTRGLVSGGGRKPWRQKGTGRARQGSIRSPQWVGGGTVFGPNVNKNYKKKINKKVKLLGFRSGLSYKAQSDSFLLINNLDFKKPSSKDFNSLLKNLKLKNKKILLILDASEKTENIFLSARNFKKLTIATYIDLQLTQVLKADKIMLTTDSMKLLTERFDKKIE